MKFALLPFSADLLMVEDVEHVLIRKQQRYLLWTNDIFEPVLLMAVNPLKEKQSSALWKKTVFGRYPPLLAVIFGLAAAIGPPFIFLPG